MSYLCEFKADPAKYPFYPRVPKDRAGNLAFRRRLIQLGDDDEGWRRDIWDMCRLDILFFINAFCFLLEPRIGGRFAILPWITWPKQDEILDQMGEAFGKRDICVFKSRDNSGTWSNIVPIFHKVTFGENYKFLVMSKKEDGVDKAGDEGSLMSKFDFLYERLPGWLKFPLRRYKNHFENVAGANAIDGESTTSTSGSGARKFAVLMDEFSKMDEQAHIYQTVGAVTDCRITNFTPWHSAEYARRLTTNTKICQIQLPFWINPKRFPGLYTSHNGKLEILDKGFAFPPNYSFKLDGKVRSIWIDNKEATNEHSSTEMEMEYWMEWFGGQQSWFDRLSLDHYERTVCHDPWLRGEMVFDERDPMRSPAFMPSSDGRLLLWVNLDHDGRPPQDDYSAGADIAGGNIDSAGRGASNSSIDIWSRAGCFQVAQFTTGGLDPKQFARYALAICSWFRSGANDPAYLKWEGGPPGQMFGTEAMQLGMRRVYRPANDSDEYNPKRTDNPGWAPSITNKKVLFRELNSAILERRPVIRSRYTIMEMRDYIYGRDGQPVHQSTQNTDDPTNSRENHGDRVVGAMLAWSECARAAVKKVEVIKPEHDLETLLGRREHHERMRRERRAAAAWG